MTIKAWLNRMRWVFPVRIRLRLEGFPSPEPNSHNEVPPHPPSNADGCAAVRLAHRPPWRLGVGRAGGRWFGGPPALPEGSAGAGETGSRLLAARRRGAAPSTQVSFTGAPSATPPMRADAPSRRGGRQVGGAPGLDRRRRQEPCPGGARQRRVRSLLARPVRVEDPHLAPGAGCVASRALPAHASQGARLRGYAQAGRLSLGGLLSARLRHRGRTERIRVVWGPEACGEGRNQKL